MRTAQVIVWMAWASGATARGDDRPPAPVPTGDIFGELGSPLPTATAAQLAAFERGRQVALRRFTPETGLGPAFNVTSCGSCHEKPVLGGSAGRYRNFLLVADDGAEAAQRPTGKHGVQLQFDLSAGGYHASDPTTTRVATRNPIPFFGAGLIAALPEDAILANDDPDDADGNGISGRANLVDGVLGRFGRKAQLASVEGFIRGPLDNHLGVTSNPLTEARRAQLSVASASDAPITDTDGVLDPELTDADLFDLMSFCLLTAAPRPEPLTAAGLRGERRFADAACGACHVATLAGPSGPLPLYSDLLLHDMGPGLADGIRQQLADGAEFRTTPLWGIVAVSPYLHDGRADTLEEAILAHGGEAQASRDVFAALPAADQADLLEFLASLGGRSQRSDGLLSPGAGVPDVGTLGGPGAALDDAQRDRFVEGRRLFDLDLFVTRGLGPRFNGDSCRACHFDPVIGGGGPLDVNVTRHGVVAGDAFTPTAVGTMLHRFALAPDARVEPDVAANVFEQRQPPPLFGLGLIEQIAAATIVAGEDPLDLDGDGISGRARRLGADVGRLGWKAGVPNLAEFARDALSNELGVTLEAQPGRTFGFATDADDVADPEMSAEEIEALTFYMQQLAPPPRAHTPGLEAVEAQGEARFVQIGCDGCHTPNLPTAALQRVALYSDLLLHQLVGPSVIGIPDDVASMQEFRTPPLWGLRASAPYMHDGHATTVDAAIARHGGEATAARTRYLDLTAAQQRALRVFLGSL